MGHTNSTPNYSLPQFLGTDKPAWLSDVNQAYSDIDTGIYNAKAAADGAQLTADGAVGGVATANTRMDGIQNQLNTVDTQASTTAATVSTHTTQIGTLANSVNTINGRLGSTDISAIGDGTVTGAIDAISQGGGGGGTGLEVVESGIANISNGSGTYGHAINVTGYKLLFIEIGASALTVVPLTLNGYATAVPYNSSGPGVNSGIMVNFATGAVTVTESVTQINALGKIYGLR